MTALDYAVLVAYFAAVMIAGLWLARRAAGGSDAYFLAGRELPWWALGCSGMASNLDVAGTMTVVTLITVYGLQGFFIEFRGGVVLPIAVFLAFMGKWHRRSGVMTTAEWMLLRFGEGRGGRLARATAAATYVVITVAMIVFFLAAGGRFLAAFLPFTPTQCTIGMAAVAFGYTLAGGLYGVVWTDVVQAAIIGAAAVYVAFTAAAQVSPELLAAWPGAALNQLLPFLAHPGLSPYEPFWVFLIVWAGKGVLEGLGGSGGSAYMAQRFYAARSEADCRRIGMLWTVLFAVRWPMVLGFAILAIAAGIDVRTLADAEAVLPQVLRTGFFPSGVRGLVIAAMMAAAMSTFDSTINAGASYVVRDLFLPLRPRTTERGVVWAGYLASALLVGVAMWLTFGLGMTVLGIWVGIVMLLFPAFLVPFALRWFWARFNGEGFTAGVAAGFAAAAWLAFGAPAWGDEATRFLAIAACSAVVSVVVALATPPVPTLRLAEFYTQTRPMGWWPREWKCVDRAEHRANWRLLGAALGWQVLTFLLPMAAVLGMWAQALPALLLWLALGWYVWRGARSVTGVPAARSG
ncbi:MAG TPA: hypothetical protein VK178_14405 [Opitutaceae bacterium]|nr:hypothetical protein [Opitutaceae bacterium]